MSLSAFHPVVARWFAERLGEPTPAQQRGWEAIRAGPGHPDRGADRLRQDARGFPHRARPPASARALAGTLPDETRVVYVSPLKALSADIHRNLAEPRREIRRLAEEMGFGAPRITAAVRSGDTPAAERAAMLKTPPHILVTTPESLYLLLTAERSREMLRTVRTVIVDEIHAVLESRRGAHLALEPRAAGACRRAAGSSGSASRPRWSRSRRWRSGWRCAAPGGARRTLPSSTKATAAPSTSRSSSPARRSRRSCRARSGRRSTTGWPS